MTVTQHGHYRPFRLIAFCVRILICLMVLSLAGGRVYAQVDPVCGMQYFSSKHKLIEPVVFPRAKDNAANEDTFTYIIPTVVHIIHNGGAENISDAAVVSQLNSINLDYNDPDRTGPRGNVKFIFCLATLDPQGNPTTGIIRVKSPEHSTISFASEEETKKLSRWPRERYLNIWVVKRIVNDDDNNKTILGYAYRPSALANSANKNMDGVVVDYRFFGKNQPHQIISDFRLGKTLTHEIGHYFDLLHTWGRDGVGQGGCFDDDMIDDTPVCDGPYTAKYIPTLNRCDKPQQCGNIRQTENYMDYSIDRCLQFFTEGQANFMRTAIMRYRASLVNYTNTVNTGCAKQYRKFNPNINTAISFSPNPSNGVINFYAAYHEPVTVNGFIFNLLGQQVAAFRLNDITDGKTVLDLRGLQAGSYIMLLQIGDEKRTEKLIIVP